MKLQAFKIKNYRSIKDSGWQNFSPDGITGLIGQNEAGKTTILEALYGFSTAEITEDVVRSDGSMPEVSLSFAVTWDEVKDMFPDNTLPKGLAKFINEKIRINLTRVWTEVSAKGNLILEEQVLSDLFTSSDDYSVDEDIQGKETTEGMEGENQKISKDKFIERVFASTPDFDFFEDFASLLPNTIDLADLQNNNTKTEGYKGAKNLLAIAGLKLDDLQGSDRRILENRLGRINTNVTGNFQEFWRQKIGKTNKISIEFELKHHDESNHEKAGRPYLVFWIKDGKEKLYPKQRSKGVRWFTSFYLQLKASSIEDRKHGQIILIDEPGGSLHARAQEDVLKVFKDIEEKIQVIYTTHSPYLVTLKTIYRLLAVQRADEEDDKSETRVFGTHQLGAVSTDTLSPVYTLMGADFSSQQTIQKENNILLEEVSAFYYLTSFWKLSGSTKSTHFLPATGTSNIPQLANMFLGWGIHFGVVVDDDSSGRSVYNELKRDLFGGDDTKAKERMLKIRDCSGIEDIFTTTDFKKYILEDSLLAFRQKNSEYVRGKPKAVFALRFMLKVNDGKITLTDLQKDTQIKIKELVAAIEARLN